MKKQITAKTLPILRKKLLKKQKGKCAVCGKKPKRPCLDHSHQKRIKGTGLVRGVVCSNCNVFLAKSENNCIRYAIKIKKLPKRLRQIADYLEHYENNPTKFIHPSEKPKNKVLKKVSYNKLKKVFEENPGRKKKFPTYNMKGNKKKQILTKELENLFKLYNIKPEFYK